MTDGADNLRLFVEQPPEYTVAELQSLLEWIPADEFWSKQVRTLGGIRKRATNGSYKLENAMAAMLSGPKGEDREANEMRAGGEDAWERTQKRIAYYNDPEGVKKMAKGLAEGMKG